MKAAVLEEINKPLKITDVSKPKVESGEVLIRIKAAALNHRDVWITKGMYAGIRNGCILGSDGAGIVEEVGKEVSLDWIGKEVVINPGLQWGNNQSFQSKKYHIKGTPTDGFFAEYAIVPASNIYKKPKHLSFEQAAALPTTGVTAFRAVFEKARITKGEVVLITGIGGGVALNALQFASNLGARCFVTSGSDDKISKAFKLGAEGGINYKSENWWKKLKSITEGIDVVIDGAGGDGISNLIGCMNPGGRMVVYGSSQGKYNNLSPQIIFWKQLQLLGTSMGSEKDFSEMVEFVDEHKIVPVVDEIFSFHQIKEAMEKLESGRQFGKIVLRID